MSAMMEPDQRFGEELESALLLAAQTFVFACSASCMCVAIVESSQQFHTCRSKPTWTNVELCAKKGNLQCAIHQTKPFDSLTRIRQRAAGPKELACLIAA